MGLLSTIGTIGGAVLGGPTGAMIGGALGTALDGTPNVSGAYNAAANQYAQNAQLAQFRPVGITTNFGQSNFTVDPKTGQLTAAGYTLNPQLQSLQTSLLGGYGNALQQAQNFNTAPITQASQSLFNLGQGLLPTNMSRTASPEALALAQRYNQASQGLMPTSFATQASPEAQAYANQLRNLSSQVLPASYDTAEAAKQYTQQQQELLAPGREQQLAGVRNRLFQTGRTGLATGGTSTGLQATNPEMAAYYNSLAQQDKAIAAGAEQQARANLAQDISLGTQLGTGALNTQTTSEQLARQNMLQNLGLSLGYGTQGYTTGATAEDLARSRYAQDISLSQGLLTGGTGLMAQVPALQNAYYSPLQTQLSLGESIEKLGQQPLDISAQLGGRTATAGQNMASILNQGAMLNLQGANAQADINAARNSTLQYTLGNIFSTPTAQTTTSNWFNNILGANQGFINM